MNIFTVLIDTLNTVSVSGEANMNKMLGVINTLRKMEAAANEGEDDGEESNR